MKTARFVFLRLCMILWSAGFFFGLDRWRAMACTMMHFHGATLTFWAG